MRPAASFVGSRRGQDDPFLRRRRRRGLEVVGAAAVHELDRRDLLLDAVLKDLEIALLQVGHELAGSVANDDVGRDQNRRGPGTAAPDLECPGWRVVRSRESWRRRAAVHLRAPACQLVPAVKRRA